MINLEGIKSLDSRLLHYIVFLPGGEAMLSKSGKRKFGDVRWKESHGKYKLIKDERKVL